MFRSIVSVVVGYVVMAVVVMLSFLPVFWSPDILFQQDSVNVKPAFSIMSLVTGFFAALLGGFVAGWVARKGRPVKVLAGLVLIFGIVEAVATLSSQKPVVKADDVASMTPFERASKGTPPTWYVVMLPVVGFMGVLLGEKMWKREGGRTAMNAGVDSTC